MRHDVRHIIYNNIYKRKSPLASLEGGSLTLAPMSADATCSTMESYSNSSARVPESSGNREVAIPDGFFRLMYVYQDVHQKSRR